jgi:hypothetical protein
MDATIAPLPPRWSVPRLVAFRFATAYFVAYALLNGNTSTIPVAFIAYRGQVPDRYAATANHVVAALGHALGIHGPILAADNDDSVGGHLLVLVIALVAVAVTVVWSVADRRRTDYVVANERLRVGVRYLLGLTVFAYAIFKVFPTQMSAPSPARLFETYGESSRMKLLWTFMGASPLYEMFAGWVELVGRALLVFRRTTVLGALILCGTLTNVLVMDIGYEVPAKICVLHLLLMALFLVAPSARRLADVLVYHRAVPALVDSRAPGRRWLVVHAVFIAGIVAVEGVPVAQYYFTVRDGAPRPALYGAYDVDEMRRGTVVVEPLLTDRTYLEHVAIDRRRVDFVFVDGTRIGFASGPEADDGSFDIDEGATHLWVVRAPDGHVDIDGTLRDAPLSLRLRPTDPRRLRLVRGGARWFGE